VHYRPEDSRWDQWVFNGADIDRARVIWAHDLGAARNPELIRDYPDRTIWLVDGLTHPRLTVLRHPLR
jgi:hypothetical protein